MEIHKKEKDSLISLLKDITNLTEDDEKNSPQILNLAKRLVLQLSTFSDSDFEYYITEIQRMDFGYRYYSDIGRSVFSNQNEFNSDKKILIDAINKAISKIDGQQESQKDKSKINLGKLIASIIISVISAIISGVVAYNCSQTQTIEVANELRQTQKQVQQVQQQVQQVQQQVQQVQQQQNVNVNIQK